ELKSVNRAGSESELGAGSANGSIPVPGSPAATAIEAAKKALGEAVKDVRLSKRLLESPACVVVDSDDPSLQLRELMKQLGGSEMAEDLAKVLLGQALLVEGAKLADPADFALRLTRLLA